MKKMTALLFVICFILALPLNAQSTANYKDEVLMTIGDRKITAGEFERIYQKNNNESVSQKQSPEEYLDMFINFKLKVIEAENLGMDTTKAFLDEYNSYRAQLARPYLSDPDAVDRFAHEAYERMKKEIHASHILVSLDPKASPEDTLYAWNKIMTIRKRILDGEDFDKVARATSDDPSAKRNGGDLGWFSVFRMVLPFEDAAYSTPVGEISMPFRSQFGYHIIKVQEVRPARGSVHVAHIFIRAPQSEDSTQALAAKKKIFAIYDSLQNGIDFATLAKDNSDDRVSAVKGGELQWFGSGQMIEEFENAAFALKNPGDVSKPFQSFYGWHMVKLLGKKGVGTFEEEKPNIVPKFGNGPRGYLRKQAFIAKVKHDYNYTFNQGSYDKITSLVDTSIFSAKWKNTVPDNVAGLVLFTIADQKVTAGEFADYLEKKQTKTAPISLVVYMNELFNNFMDEKLTAYEDSQLERKYPDFRNVLQEYHDGILLFDLTDKTVWSKAVKDSAGLENYYKNHKNEYMWEKRAEAYTIVLKDSSLLDQARTLTEKKGGKKKFSQSYLISKLCKGDTIPCVTVEYGKYEKGDNKAVDATGWTQGIGKTFNKDGKPAFVYVKSTLPPQGRKLDEARGLVTADYQKYLENNWVKELRNKYPVHVNQDVLAKIRE